MTWTADKPMRSTIRIALGFVVLIAGFGVVNARPNDDPATLVKLYDGDCAPSKAGQQYELAEVKGASLCASIARAYNFARTADRPERIDEFGMCWNKYSFHCVRK